MKTERLLEIIIFLLNRESASARQLAERFGVSVRTIQRDMASISLAGVPLLSSAGSFGGYSIMPDYKIRNHFLNKEDFRLIVLALKSLRTGYDNSRLEAILDKYLSLNEGAPAQVFLDYGVTRENTDVQNMLVLIESCIADSAQLEFDYRNAEGRRSRKRAAPLALRFKWYAWYLFAFDMDKGAYRTYKVARMGGLKRTDRKFERPADVEALLLESEREYLKTCEDIEVWCQHDCVPVLEEYFPEEKREPLPDGHCLMHLHVPPDERMWQALLLSMGGGVRIISPSYYRDRLIEAARKFLANYEE